MRLAFLALVCAPVCSPAQQWPVHSLYRPRPPIVDPGPERPLALQDHGVRVRYRDVWIRSLPEVEP